QVTSGNVLIKSGHTLLVTNEVNVAGGSLTFEDDASLVQTNEATNTGDIIYYRTTSGLNAKDYVYWSSPVANFQLGQLSATPSNFKAYDPRTSTGWVSV